jgi:hypothetical protein
MNQIFEDLLCYPAMYVLHSVMGIMVLFSPKYWHAWLFEIYPTLLMTSTMLLGVFVVYCGLSTALPFGPSDLRNAPVETGGLRIVRFQQ